MRKMRPYILIGLGILLLGMLVLCLDIPHWKRLDMDKIYAQPMTTMVYDAAENGAAALHSGENRRWVSLSEIPDHAASAFIAAEDQRFYEHGGVDLKRIFGALWHDVKTRSFAQGASTITQQLVKLTHLNSEKTLSRKTQEIVLALALEQRLSKNEILEAYLNTVYFGNGAYGLEAAAQAYFDKSAARLTLAESALLAGVIKSPSRYAPHISPENAMERRNFVLSQMAETGAISAEACEKAQAAPLGLEMQESLDKQSWYMDQVLAETQQLLDMDAEEILSAGLQIYTALEPQLQASADALFANGANFPDPAADGTPVQAALIAMDSQSGEIRAVVGGRSYDVRRGLNRATQIKRQPGSAIKPVSTYAAAIEAHGLLPSSMVQDVRREFAGGYNPVNAGGHYYGRVSLREALSRSLNVATVDLADLIGMQTVRRTIGKFGLPMAAQDVNLALALGSMTHGVSPAQLCGAYCALANGGTLVSPHTIRKIVDSNGKTLYRFGRAEERAVSESTAFLLTDMLKTAATEGSARALKAVGMSVAGKTGTVGEEDGGNRDAWTAAYTPELAVAVWMGFDEPSAEHALADYNGGSGYPARLCAAFLQAAAPLLSGRDFEAPEELISLRIDKAALEATGEVFLASANTPEEYAADEWFFRDNTPTQVSTLWNAPQTVDDLQLLSESGEPPALAFTSRDDFAEYIILRKSDGRSEIATILSAAAGEVIVWVDTQAELAQSWEYSVLPRHRLLYQNGTLLAGVESEGVQYTPKGLLNRLFG